MGTVTRTKLIVFNGKKDYNEEAYQYWLKEYSFIQPSARNYLSRDACIKKYALLTNVLRDNDLALDFIKVDPSVLTYSSERVQEIYNVWLEKLKGDENSLQELLVRNP
jgi:hypothetical protein